MAGKVIDFRKVSSAVTAGKRVVKVVRAGTTLWSAETPPEPKGSWRILATVKELSGSEYTFSSELVLDWNEESQTWKWSGGSENFLSAELEFADKSTEFNWWRLRIRYRASGGAVWQLHFEQLGDRTAKRLRDMLYERDDIWCEATNIAWSEA